VNVFRQVINLIKLSASSNYHAGFEKSHSSLLAPGQCGNPDVEVWPPNRSRPASGHSTLMAPSFVSGASAYSEPVESIS
jgi:hypothetical protein